MSSGHAKGMFNAPNTLPLEDLLPETRLADELNREAILLRAESQPVLQRDPNYRRHPSKSHRHRYLSSTDYSTRECERFFGT